MTDTVPPKAMTWMAHLPLIFSTVVVTNFLLQMVFLAKGSLSIAQTLVAADPIKIGLTSTLLLLPVLLIIVSNFAALNIATQEKPVAKREVLWLVLAADWIISLFVLSMFNSLFLYIQSLAFLLLGLHARGGMNRVLPYWAKRKSDFSEVRMIQQDVRRRTRRRKRGQRVIDLRYWLLRRAFDIRKRLPSGGRWRRLDEKLAASSARWTRDTRAFIDRMRDEVAFSQEVLDLVEAALDRPDDEVNLEKPPPSKGLSYWVSAQVSIAVLNVALAILAFLIAGSVLPVQAISVSNVGDVTGYVLSTSSPTTTILIDEPRRVITVRTTDVTLAQPCAKVKNGKPTVSDTRFAHPIFWTPLFVSACPGSS